MKRSCILALLVLGLALCVSANTQVTGDFDLWEESSPEEWQSYVDSLPDVPKMENGDWEPFNVSTACKFAMYKQCDSRWGSIPLGHKSSSICKVGCAMSSVAMYLKTRGKNYNPKSLNTWLKGHGGYQGNLIVWGAVNKLGLTYRGQQKPTQQQIINGLKACHGVISNVNGGGHWVLLTGYAGNGNFKVNDPGYNRATYPFSQMLRHSVYH